MAATTLGRIAIQGRTEAGQARSEPEARLDAAEADAATKDAVIVHVRDARAGEIDVFRGTSQVTVRDRDLAARIVRASR